MRVRRLFGSIDKSLLRNCPCPVWVLKPEIHGPFDQIRVAVDLQTHDECHKRFIREIMEIGFDLANAHDAQLHVVTAWSLWMKQPLRSRGPAVDISLDNFWVSSSWNLTRPQDGTALLGPIMRLHARGAAMLIAACGGIASSETLAKVLLAGADVAMVVSAIYRHGIGAVRTMIDGLTVLMEKHHFESVIDLQMRRPIEFDNARQREDYLDALSAQLCTETRPSAGDVTIGDRFGHVEIPRQHE